MYIVEKKPLMRRTAGRLTNPITAQMRKLEVGESFFVAWDDLNWTGSQVRNENARPKGPRYATLREPHGLRIGRVE